MRRSMSTAVAGLCCALVVQAGAPAYLMFEYLPQTAANLALTDIRAQHRDATGP